MIKDVAKVVATHEQFNIKFIKFYFENIGWDFLDSRRWPTCVYFTENVKILVKKHSLASLVNVEDPKKFRGKVASLKV